MVFFNIGALMWQLLELIGITKIRNCAELLLKSHQQQSSQFQTLYSLSILGIDFLNLDNKKSVNISPQNWWKIITTPCPTSFSFKIVMYCMYCLYTRPMFIWTSSIVVDLSESMTYMKAQQATHNCCGLRTAPRAADDSSWKCMGKSCYIYLCNVLSNKVHV